MSLLVVLDAPIANSSFSPAVVSWLEQSLYRTVLIKIFIGETIQIRIGWEDYRDKIVDYGHIKVYAMASVQETKQLWSEENDFQLEKPKLDIQVSNPKCYAYFLLPVFTRFHLPFHLL